MKITQIIVFVFAILPIWNFAQNETNKQIEIQLLDQVESTPISEVDFNYGNQSGQSNIDGKILFSLQEDDTMKLFHPDYGAWEWTNLQIKELALNKVYYRKSIVLQLYPVNIISVKPEQQPTDRISLDYESRMAHDGATILNQLPAFNSIRKSGNYGFDPVFRGYKYDQLNIVLNGAQSATAACPNRMDPPTSQMSPNMIDRVEVLKGPYALRYGTGFGATINFLPTALKFTSKPDVYGRVSGGYESNGNIKRSEGQVGISSKRIDFNVLGAWSDGDDYLTGARDTVNAGFSRTSLGANLGVKLTDKQQLRMSANYNMARDAEFPSLPMDLRNDDTWMFNLRHDYQINREFLKSWNTSLYGSFVDHLMDNGLRPDEGKMINASTLAQTFNYGGRTESKWRIKNSSLFAGADFRMEGADGTRTREFLMGPNKGKIVEDNVWQDGSISKAGVFGEYNLKTKAFTYVFSGRVEYNSALINDAADEFLNVNDTRNVSQINPSLSAGISKSIKKSKIGLWIGRVQRSGSLTERFINFFPVGQDPYEVVGNPNLNPEVNNQIDLTYNWNKKKTAISFDVFGSYLQDMISSRIDTTLSPRLPSSPGVRQFTNIEKGFKTGFELEWAQELIWGLQHKLGVAYTYAQDLTRGEALPEIPPFDARYTISARYLKDKLIPQATFRYVAEQARISEEYGETVTPSFFLLDAKIGYTINEYLQFNIGVNNILDENYYEHLTRSVKGTSDAIYAPGRNIFVNLSVTF